MKKHPLLIGVASALLVLGGLVSAPRLLSLGKAKKTGEVAGGASLYQLTSRWTTDAGDHIALRDLRGRVQVLALIFTNCPGACPTMVKDMQAVESALPRKARRHTRFVLVSIDPERDTVEALREYRKHMGLDPRGWTLLRGDPADVRELAAVLGFNYAQDAALDIAHSNLITVIGPGGEILHQQSGVHNDPVSVAGVIESAL